jgi:hypothetical protein
MASEISCFTSLPTRMTSSGFVLGLLDIFFSFVPHGTQIPADTPFRVLTFNRLDHCFPQPLHVAPYEKHNHRKLIISSVAHSHVLGLQLPVVPEGVSWIVSQALSLVFYQALSLDIRRQIEEFVPQVFRFEPQVPAARTPRFTPPTRP